MFFFIKITSNVRGSPQPLQIALVLKGARRVSSIGSLPLREG